MSKSSQNSTLMYVYVVSSTSSALIYIDQKSNTPTKTVWWTVEVAIKETMKFIGFLILMGQIRWESHWGNYWSIWGFRQNALWKWEWVYASKSIRDQTKSYKKLYCLSWSRTLVIGVTHIETIRENHGLPKVLIEKSKSPHRGDMTFFTEGVF